VAVAKQVVELLLDRDKKVVVQQDFLSRRLLAFGDAKRDAVVPLDGKHLPSPKSELSGLQLGFRMVEHVPDTVKHSLRDECFALSARRQRLDISRLDLLVLGIGRETRAFHRLGCAARDLTSGLEDAGRLSSTSTMIHSHRVKGERRGRYRREVWGEAREDVARVGFCRRARRIGASDAFGRHIVKKVNFEIVWWSRVGSKLVWRERDKGR
jgi:hypothetical protein